VHPLADRLQARALGQARGGDRHLHELLGHPDLAQLLRAGAAAGDPLERALAGALGDVRRDLLWSELAALVVQDLGVQLLAEEIGRRMMFHSFSRVHRTLRKQRLTARPSET
jgi:hypothetical protein